MTYSGHRGNKPHGNRLFKTLALALMAGAMTTSTEAQETPVLVKPAPIQQEGLFMPGFGNEGVITASYTVKADGTTSDVEILGGFTNPLYEKTITDNIAKWTFTPGSVNGEPQDFLNQRHTFKIQVAAELGISADVQKELVPLQELINAREFEKAADSIDGLLQGSVHSVFDYALLNQMMATAQVGLNDPFSALEYIRKGTTSVFNMQGGREYLMTPDILRSALRQRVVMAATVRAQHDVLATWAALGELGEVAADDPVREWVTAAEQQLASPDPLLALGKITDEVWEHSPTYRIFTVADVREGSLDKIIAHCDRRTLELDYQEGVDWTLPASFGACELRFEGKDGTLFSIYEFAQ
jgi:hypothetical protein